MKVVILAGGMGTRLMEETKTIPKPMVEIGGKPILWHIMKIYEKYGFNEFIICLGYKSHIIKRFFHDYYLNNSDLSIEISENKVITHHTPTENFKITLVETGLNTNTAGRIKRIKEYIGSDPSFFLTYGDGVADIDIDALVRFHRSHGKMATVSAVHPGARFGELDIQNHVVTSFKEKPQTTQGWINGGYFVMEPAFFDLIKGDETVLEKEPLEKVAQIGELMSYQHEGFWQCMDTKRDRDVLEELWQSDQAPWK
jgi:glucose-1-phosphate cytidylyltransferase